MTGELSIQVGSIDIMAIIKTAKNEHTLQYIKTRANSDLYKSKYDDIDWGDLKDKDHSGSTQGTGTSQRETSEGSNPSSPTNTNSTSMS